MLLHKPMAILPTFENIRGPVHPGAATSPYETLFYLCQPQIFSKAGSTQPGKHERMRRAEGSAANYKCYIRSTSPGFRQRRVTIGAMMLFRLRSTMRLRDRTGKAPKAEAPLRARYGGCTAVDLSTRTR